MGEEGVTSTVVIVAVVVIATVGVSVYLLLKDEGEEGGAEGGLASRGSIYINGDANFNTAKGVVGGSGTENDPYIIRWLEHKHGERPWNLDKEHDQLLHHSELLHA